MRADSRYGPQPAAGPLDEAGQRAQGERADGPVRQVGAGQYGLPAALVRDDRAARRQRGRRAAGGEQAAEHGARGDGGRGCRGPHEGAARAARKRAVRGARPRVPRPGACAGR